jgi:hypothetical protein
MIFLFLALCGGYAGSGVGLNGRPVKWESPLGFFASWRYTHLTNQRIDPSTFFVTSSGLS